MNKHKEIAHKYVIGDLVQVCGILGLVVQKLFSKDKRWYLIDFLSKTEFEPRLVHESDIFLLTRK
jgi:hypothetical protein